MRKSSLVCILLSAGAGSMLLTRAELDRRLERVKGFSGPMILFAGSRVSGLNTPGPVLFRCAACGLSAEIVQGAEDRRMQERMRRSVWELRESGLDISCDEREFCPGC
ncbi:MAG: hypothetical protein HPZ91_19570 [Lentisphaeria bacterium]|nr:hypothetical protein [Lentisphaeria bacterium]